MKPLAIVTLRPEPAYRRNAFVDGLKRLGYDVICASTTKLLPRSRGDLLILWNKKKGQDERTAADWERRGGTVLVIENAYLQKVDKSAYAISVHDHNGAGWFPVTGDFRFAALGFDLKPETDNMAGYSLVIGQRGIGSSVMASPPHWGEKMMGALRGRNAKLRVHPGQFAPKVPLEKDLAGARDCHIWNSSVGVRALIEGIKVHSHAPHWVCKGAGHGRDRLNALNEMAQGQWSVAEIETGEPFVRMRDAGWGPAWR